MQGTLPVKGVGAPSDLHFLRAVCNANWEWMGASLAHDRRVGAALGDVEIIQDLGGIRSRWRQAVGLVTRP